MNLQICGLAGWEDELRLHSVPEERLPENPGPEERRLLLEDLLLADLLPEDHPRRLARRAPPYSTDRVPHFLLDTGGMDFVSCRGGDFGTAVQPGVGGAIATDLGRRAGVVAHGFVAAGMRVVGLADSQRPLEGDELSSGVGTAGARGDNPRAAKAKFSRSTPPFAGASYAGAGSSEGVRSAGFAAPARGAGGERREPPGAYLE